MAFPSKEAAHEAMEQARRDWLAQARAWLDLHPTGAELTVDDVRAAVGVPLGADPRVMGVLFKSPGWEPVRFRNSDRARCHKRPIRVFRRVG